MMLKALYVNHFYGFEWSLILLSLFYRAFISLVLSESLCGLVFVMRGLVIIVHCVVSLVINEVSVSSLLIVIVHRSIVYLCRRFLWLDYALVRTLHHPEKTQVQAYPLLGLPIPIQMHVQALSMELS